MFKDYDSWELNCGIPIRLFAHLPISIPKAEREVRRDSQPGSQPPPLSSSSSSSLPSSLFTHYVDIPPTQPHLPPSPGLTAYSSHLQSHFPPFSSPMTSSPRDKPRNPRIHDIPSLNVTAAGGDCVATADDDELGAGVGAGFVVVG
jgi:hypothetical protein